MSSDWGGIVPAPLGGDVGDLAPGDRFFAGVAEPLVDRQFNGIGLDADPRSCQNG
jgi:hypothetical protein